MPRLIHLLAVLCLTASGMAWASHVDMPAASDAAVAAHAHIDAGELIDRCDHCCHAGAHLLALAPIAGAAMPSPAPALPTAGPTALPNAVADPPFIPPIA